MWWNCLSKFVYLRPKTWTKYVDNIINHFLDSGNILWVPITKHIFHITLDCMSAVFLYRESKAWTGLGLWLQFFFLHFVVSVYSFKCPLVITYFPCNCFSQEDFIVCLVVHSDVFDTQSWRTGTENKTYFQNILLVCISQLPSWHAINCLEFY